MTQLLKLCEFEIACGRKACEEDENSAMPKLNELSRSFDPSGGLISEVVPPHQPVI
jgi:hypothetical protein